MITYESIEKEIAQAKKDATVEVERLETKKRLFINNQTFNGAELMVMRNIMRIAKGDSSSDEPNLFYVLEKILKERGKE